MRKGGALGMGIVLALGAVAPHAQAAGCDLKGEYGYVYDGVYYTPGDWVASFGQAGGEATAIRTRTEVVLWHRTETAMPGPSHLVSGLVPIRTATIPQATRSFSPTAPVGRPRTYTYASSAEEWTTR